MASTSFITLPAARSDRVLGFGAVAMLAVVLAALIRGRAHWGEVPGPVWGHLALLIPALILTPVIMAGGKGHRRHRVLGWTWVALMMGVAVESFAIRPSDGGFSPIWIISIFVLVAVPRLVVAARRHRIATHRGSARGIVIGAFLVAGFFTLPFGRMLGRWLFHG